jgi:hypothetical protein
MMPRLLISVCVLWVGFVAGCSEDSMAPSVQRVTVSPADGAIGVRLDEAVVLSFARPADRGAVERSFRLLGEGSMTDTLCSEDSTRVGDMTKMMGDDGMMEHMLALHSIPGSFQWNGDRECAFVPTGWMEADRRYMIYLGAEMMDGMEGMDGMMSRVGTTGPGTALHFRTLVPESHEGHH